MSIDSNKRVLYLGGFELPNKNAAAQRVIGIGKILLSLGYEVFFLNRSRRETEDSVTEGFEVIYPKSGNNLDYRVFAFDTLNHIKRVNPSIVIAYNYPSLALKRILRYSKRKKIMCICDVTEWNECKPFSIRNVVRSIDTWYRMERIQKKVDGIIAISRFLYDYYRPFVKTVLIPPLVDISDSKWNVNPMTAANITSYVYAGSPSSNKERLDEIVRVIESMPDSFAIELRVVGITEGQFRKEYNFNEKISQRVVFYGRVEHEKAIEIIKTSSWATIIRDDNRVVTAGFPTKLVESITCGTPVIINPFSNVKDYLTEENCILVENPSELFSAIYNSYFTRKDFDTTIFDYHNYIDSFLPLLS